MPQAVDLEPKEPKIDNQCGLSQIDAIRASDIWRGRLTNKKGSMLSLMEPLLWPWAFFEE